MAGVFDSILRELPGYREAAAALREVLLANLVMIGEAPAPTFGEKQRIDLALDRFGEAGLNNCSLDEVGNGFGVLPGSSGEGNIFLVAPVSYTHLTLPTN